MNKELHNSIDYIRNKTQNEHGFSVPENYLDTVDEILLSKLIEKQLPIENGFVVSEDYFDTMEASLFSNINFPKKESKVISIRKRITRYIPSAAAASVLLFFGLNYFSLTTTTSFDDISFSDIDHWFDQGDLDLNTTNTFFIDADFTENNLLEDDSLSDEDLLEYLSTIDNSTLTEIEL
ncbi:MAG: hypothetical protein P8K77_03525 [Polaribacter sp.]|nr:hypothetical protein [Polaribacter sp.]